MPNVERTWEEVKKDTCSQVKGCKECQYFIKRCQHPFRPKELKVKARG